MHIPNTASASAPFAASLIDAQLIDATPDDPLIAMADPALDSRVVVLSPGAIDLACTLLRRGHHTASVVRLDDGIPAHQADIVLIPRPATAAFLERAIPFARRLLAPMGALAAHLAPDQTGVEHASARQLLLLNGFTAIRITTACGDTLIGAELPLHGRLQPVAAPRRAQPKAGQS